jgi:hypothetical protein
MQLVMFLANWMCRNSLGLQRHVSPRRMKGVHGCMRTCVHVCMCACACACVCVCVCMCVCVSWEQQTRPLHSPVRVAGRAEHAGDDELRLGIELAKHAHERDAAA